MPLDIKDIADKADMIINGYAFTRDGEYIRILNLSLCLLIKNQYQQAQDYNQYHDRDHIVL